MQTARIAMIATLLLVVAASTLVAQEVKHYNPHLAFDPQFLKQSGAAFRSASGAPGPEYWQNRADYVITASLDTVANTLSAHEVITYTNRSPDVLPYVWLQLDQNIMKKDSRGALTQSGFRRGEPESAEGFDVKSVSVTDHGERVRVTTFVTDTRMQIILPSPVPPRGGTVAIEVDYRFAIPRQGAGRMGRAMTPHGTIYEIAQWYPRMAVYDDQSGWNNLPYLGSGEFYLEYGDFDYTLDVPADQIVVGSGELLNPIKVLSPQQRQKIQDAGQSDKTVTVRSVSEMEVSARQAIPGARKSWHFAMKNSRDIAWAASATFVWDAARINLPSGRLCLAMSAYPPESAGDSAFGRSTEYVKNSVEIFSRDWFEYPYAIAVNVGGSVGGEEYPGLVFCSSRSIGKGLWWVVSHEIGHNWFPMIVGSDERRFAFMDEGFNTFIDIAASDEFNHGEFAPKRDVEYAPGEGNPAREIVPLLLDPQSPPIITAADAISEQYRHPVSYFKSALGLVLLRVDILGPDRFDYAFREYIKAWAFKHPGPYDFFRAMNNGAGENLNWFWKGWFLNNWIVDQQVRSVLYVDNDPGKGSLITLATEGELPMPVTVDVKESNGHKGRVNFPVEIWQRSGEWIFKYPSTSMIDSVVVDPDQHLPDVKPANNVWTSGASTSRPRRSRN